MTLLARLLLATTFTLQISTTFAQGSAFTYQGRLNDTGSAATGNYDLQFTLFDVVSAVAGPITNSPTVVSNGLFTVILDFGSAPFTGARAPLRVQNLPAENAELKRQLADIQALVQSLAHKSQL